MLNHFHFLDSGRDGRRPMTFSRYAGPGSHRYPVGFSGDTVVSWTSLAFQPEFTATATNIGYGWWSHDVGGHMFGYRDDELALRWVQLGVFSPILRLHSSSNAFMIKEPWLFGAETAAAMSDALRFRHRLVPYLHTMNHRAATQGIPLVRPMYYAHPSVPIAYDVPNQFEFGSELIVAPITSPRDAVTLHGSVRAWLPPGAWIDLFTGLVYDGDRELELHRDDASIPALLKAGGILPLLPLDDLDATRNPGELEIVVAPGADGHFVLTEDDGTGTITSEIPTARTALDWDQATGTLTIGAATGAAGVVPSTRTWTVTVLGAGESVRRADAPTDTPLTIPFAPDPQARTGQISARLERLLNRAQYDFTEKTSIWSVLQSDRPAAAKLAALHAKGVHSELFSAIAELITVRA